MTAHTSTGITIAINAGGKSSRMGTDKALVPLAGKPMIEHVLARVVQINAFHTFLITNHPAKYAHLKLPMVGDVIPDKGSLGGIFTALHHSPSEYTLMLACDMPFLNVDLLRHMISLSAETDEAYDVIVPLHNDHPQGLHAIYRQTCQPPIRTRIEANRLKVIGFYEDMRVRYLEPTEWGQIDPDGLSFFNVNTPEDLQTAHQIATNSPS